MTTNNLVTLKINPADQMAQFIAAGQAHVASSLFVIASGVAFMLNAHGLRDANDEHYLPKGRAIEEMKAQVAKHIPHVGGQMLNIYFRNIEAVFTAVMKGNRFAGVREGYATASKPEKGAEHIHSWLTEQGATSLAKLSKMLGYSTGAPKAGAAKEGTPSTRLSETVAKAMERLENSEDFEHVKPVTIARSIANALPSNVSPIALAAEAISRAKDMARPDDLDTLLDLATTIDAIITKLTADKGEKPAKATRPRAKAAKAEQATA